MWEAGIDICTYVAISAIGHSLKRLFCSNCATRIFTLLMFLCACASFIPAQTQQHEDSSRTPPRVAQARRFLQQRGWSANRRATRLEATQFVQLKPQPAASGASTAIWQPLGPTAVMTPNFGLVTGRVSSIAIDPADVTGNHVFIGTTGGGVWVSQNAASSGNVVFTPLTDNTSAFSNSRMGSISIGALTVQPGGTEVILAGTGDPNDALDSYYGSGILRSIDGGNTWTGISQTADQTYSFAGEGFAGFAWSTVNPQLVVAAVSEAYEGTLVDAPITNVSFAGLYYSTDAGATWSLATITDGAGSNVQGPLDSFVHASGNSVTAVVWNPVRRLFVAAVRFHGYYQSTDGITWTRMAGQPGTGLSKQMCPTNPHSIGSIACPIFRGTLAVNPLTGDTFAWTVDFYNQDQGLWQDTCRISNGSCSNQTAAFGQRWSTVPLQSDTSLGSSTIANGDYNFALAAVPSAQDTLLFAGVNDLWKCSLAMGCLWRNLTNANTCMSAQVAPYQHTLTWNGSNPQEILIGNDSGLWRSMDGIAESGAVCSASDATHFQNLNQGLGSLAEVESLSQVGNSPYTLMTGLGVNGTAGVKSSTGPTSIWPQILGGEGGPVAIDLTAQTNWYVNNSVGVSIHRCSQSDDCNSAAFGASAVVDDADVGGDGNAMISPAPFMIDPLDHNQLLIGTCRLWRGPADGTAWSGANALSSMLDGVSGRSYCSGNALIRSIAAMPVSGGEVIYAGMHGDLDGGGILGGHIFKGTLIQGSSSLPSWQDVALNPVSNDQTPFNYYGLDVSSVYIDPHDQTGNTVYVTVAGVPDALHGIRTLYRTSDGGGHWVEITSNLVRVPANSVVVDPQDANTVYVSTDEGVYVTRQVAACVDAVSNCWSAFGAGLPNAPVVQLAASPLTVSPSVLVAGTYGRGNWQIPLLSAGVQLTTSAVQPDSLTFEPEPVGTTSNAQIITLTNTGGIALVVASISTDADFTETDNCVNTAVNAGANCSIKVTFTPADVGSANGQIKIAANVAGGQIVIPLSGVGSAAGLVTASPGTLSFGQVQIGTTSAALPVTLENADRVSIAITDVSVTPPFNLATNSCGDSVNAKSACAFSITFAPTEPGANAGTLTVSDSAGTQTVALAGTGARGPTDQLSPSSISFAPTVIGQLSSPQFVSLSNSGDLPLNLIAVTASVGFNVSSNCGGTLGGHASCAMSITFAPTAVGPVNGSLVVTDALGTQSIPLSGTGLTPPEISVKPTRLTFPPQAIGMTSTGVPITISNIGGAPMMNVGFQITGSSAGSFSWGASTCGGTLAKGANCVVKISFTPGTAGQLAATLAVSSSTGGVAPVQVPLTGIGQSASGISINPAQMNFTEATLGQPSPAQFATITNTTSASVSGLGVSVSPPFSETQNSCSPTLASGASCRVGVIFIPIANGVVSGVLTVSSSGFPIAATTALVGAGGAAGSVEVQPAILTFGTTGVGAKSTGKAVKLTNNGSEPLSSLRLITSGGFEVASTDCAASVDPSASCTVMITFAPTKAGQQKGEFTVSSSALAENTAVSLSGMGFDFTVSSSGQSSQTVPSGKTASYMLSLVPLNGSSGTFTFACSELPANSSCSFNPTSELVTANASGTVSVLLATGTSSTSARGGDSVDTMFHLLPLACALLGLPPAWKRRRNWIPIVLLTIGLIGITSCAGAGGGGGGTPPSGSTGNGTPAGTYSIIVTATSNGVSHETTLTLTVD